ncbi:MAG: DNA methyltransferase, partial [Ignavibacteriae bacterium]|nr:DNA methyltransferase [Ignavibacteriota bacterium]
MKIHNTLGEHIRTVRETAGLTLREVATNVSIDPSLLAKIERNQRQPTKLLIKNIALFFKIDERAMGNTMVRNKELPTFFGEVLLKGERVFTNFESNFKQSVFYQHPNGQLWKGDSIEWLKTLPDESVDVIFADPPYNIKKADWDIFESQEEYIKFSMKWIEQAARVLKPTGTLFICGFSEILADLKHPASRFFKSCRWIIWHYKNKANLGKDWGRSHESILHFRKTKYFTFNIDTIRIPYSEHTLKYPSHPQAETSQYGNGKNGNQIWEPNSLGAKPKDVLEIPQDI